MKMLNVLVLAAMICGQVAWSAEDHDDDHDHDHAHKAPHGGTLVALGDHFAHLELVLDNKDGKLTVYVLDGHAEKGQRIEQKDIMLQIEIGDAKPIDFQAVAVANKLTGEKEGDTSVFTGANEKLKGATKFKVILGNLKIKGKAFKNIEFGFPEGNEGAHK
jgi:hypothetical protein